MKGLVGRLLVGYSGRLVGSPQSCTQQDCQNYVPFEAQVAYIFPGWFLAKVFSIMAWKDRTSDLHFVVGVRHYAPDESLFQCISTGDMNGLRKLLFEQGMYPNYIEKGRGETALHVS